MISRRLLELRHRSKMGAMSFETGGPRAAQRVPRADHLTWSYRRRPPRGAATRPPGQGPRPAAAQRPSAGLEERRGTPPESRTVERRPAPLWRPPTVAAPAARRTTGGCAPRRGGGLAG